MVRRRRGQRCAETGVAARSCHRGASLRAARFAAPPGHEGRPWPEPEVDDSELVLQPCLRLLRHRYPVAWYYHEVRAEHDPALPERMDVPHLLLRRDYRTHTYPLSAAHDRFLRAVQRGGDIAQALIELADWTQQPIAQVQTSWRTRVREAWIRAGFFVRRDA